MTITERQYFKEVGAKDKGVEILILVVQMLKESKSVEEAETLEKVAIAVSDLITSKSLTKE